METVTALLESRASFLLATMFVTWVAIAMLGLVVLNLHTRMQRLESANASQNGIKPYAQLLHRNIWTRIGETAAAARPRLIFFLSSNCQSCRRILDELDSPAWQIPAAVVWSDRTPEEFKSLPANVVAAADGRQLSKELGIRVTPFLIVVDGNGRSIDASPVTDIDRLKRFAREIPTEEVPQWP